MAYLGAGSFGFSANTLLPESGNTVSLGTYMMSASTFSGAHTISTLFLSSATTAGGGITVLGTNAPGGLLSVTCGGWMTFKLSNGSNAYFPVWV